MHDYLVEFLTLEDDYCREWCSAFTVEDAKKAIFKEYCVVKEILSVTKKKN